MDPVAVYTGRADPEPGQVGGPPPAGMPMPRLRPPAAAGNATLPDETAALPEVEQPVSLVNPN
jgi:hypothetical protein